MSQELLRNYVVQKDPTVEFKLTFEIPANCNYTTSVDDLVNLVTITLNPGEKDPSPSYSSYDLDYRMINNLLTIQFEQQDLTAIENLVYVKKPTVIIDNSLLSI
ncbi:hypothetical protein [Flavobacterium sp.]|uniref:hypothetical protein n=1 Tax=Flavobacterium sp. TaxID=239 RepID=UPI002B4B6B9A|nr:hypothetical protein [Flavobacterium sp.]HLF50840.1 hypothetical protein [Flavobacterium sp.]